MKRILFLFVASAACALAGSSCTQVGGAVLTNFLDPTTTFGTATGDLAGAIGVTVLKFTPNADGTITFHNQHHWVTASGDTIQVEAAYAVGYPTPIPGLFAADYTNGVKITGGTGRFVHATGKISTWGAVNTQTGEVILRYSGEVCFASGNDR